MFGCETHVSRCTTTSGELERADLVVTEQRDANARRLRPTIFDPFQIVIEEALKVFRPVRLVKIVPLLSVVDGEPGRERQHLPPIWM